MIDPRDLGQGATGASAGLLEPPMKPRSPFQLARHASFEGYSQFVEDLNRESQYEIEFQHLPHVHLALTDEEVDKFKRWESAAGSEEQSAFWLEAQEATERWRQLSSQVKGAWVHDRGAWVYPPDLLWALKTVLEDQDVPLYLQIQNLEIEPKTDGQVQLRFLNSSQSEIQFDSVIPILCAGAWTPAILKQLDLFPEFEIQAIRGQMVELQADFQIEAIFHLENRYLYFREGNRLLIGATTEEAGFDENIYSAETDSLLDTASKAFSIDSFSVLNTWCGLRPKVLRRGGAWLRTEFPILLAGHYKNGILGGPRDADLLVSKLTGNPLESFSPFKE